MLMISSKTLINNFLFSVDKGTVSKIYSKKQTDKNENRFWIKKKLFECLWMSKLLLVIWWKIIYIFIFVTKVGQNL